MLDISKNHLYMTNRIALLYLRNVSFGYETRGSVYLALHPKSRMKINNG